MATNPPITIGEINTVPAPGSGVLSAYHQTITRRTVHRFATVAARDAAYPAAAAGQGALCVTLDTDTLWQVAMVAAVPTWTRYGTTPWTAPALGNGWANFGAPYQTARYRRIGDLVYLEGLIANGALGSAAFTLPAGFRPAATGQFAVVSNAAFGRLTVAADGTVVPAGGSVTNFQINCAFGVP